jgi:hypothetical protein
LDSDIFASGQADVALGFEFNQPAVFKGDFQRRFLVAAVADEYFLRAFLVVEGNLIARFRLDTLYLPAIVGVGGRGVIAAVEEVAYSR